MIRNGWSRWLSVTLFHCLLVDQGSCLSSNTFFSAAISPTTLWSTQAIVPRLLEERQDIEHISEPGASVIRTLAAVADPVKSGISEKVSRRSTLTEAPRSPMILVVEDHPALRYFLAHMLQSAGYRVLLAADSGEGLAAYNNDPTAIDAVITDERMPNEGDGESLIERLRLLNPKLPIVLASGTIDDSLRWRLNRKTPPIVLLDKPYKSERLLSALERVLGSAPPSSNLLIISYASHLTNLFKAFHLFKAAAIIASVEHVLRIVGERALPLAIVAGLYALFQHRQRNLSWPTRLSINPRVLQSQGA